MRLEHEHRRGRIDERALRGAARRAARVARARLRRPRQRRHDPGAGRPLRRRHVADQLRASCERVDRLGAPCRSLTAVSFDFDRVDLVGRLPSFRPPPRGVARLAHAARRRHRRSARAERRRQVDADRHAGDAGRADERHHRLRRHGRRRAPAPRIRARIGLLAHELHLYPELTARQNLEFFARLYGLDGRRPSSTARSRRPGSPIAPTTRCRRSRAACGSGWRSSARCCTRRGSCCSTSRSPGSTTAPSRIVADRLRGARRGRRDRACSRRTTSTWPTAWSRGSRSSGAAGCCRDAAADRRAAPAVSRAGGGRVMFFRIALLVLQEGLRDRAEELRDSLDDAVLRGVVRGDFLVRVRARKGRRSRTRRPASCGSRSRSPARWRSAGRSSASATARR